MTNPWTTTDTAALAKVLVAARAAGQQLATADLAIPPDLAAAFDVQTEIATLRGASVGGWKVGIGPGAVPIAAPLDPPRDIGSGPVAIPWRDKIGIEVELAVRLASDIRARPQRPWTRSELLATIDTVLLGVEITGGRLADGNAAPFTLFVADSLDNAGYVLGPDLPRESLDRVADGSVALIVTGPAPWSGVAAHALQDPLAPLLACANAEYSHLGGLRAGQIITTGALCGMLTVAEAGVVDILFDQTTTMRFAFT
jgi:2-keto-4-pentenoate hydratase